MTDELPARQPLPDDTDWEVHANDIERRIRDLGQAFESARPVFESLHLP